MSGYIVGKIAFIEWFSWTQICIREKAEIERRRITTLILLSHKHDQGSFFWKENFLKDLLRYLFDFLPLEYYAKKEGEKLLKFVQNDQFYQEIERVPKNCSSENLKNWYLGTQRVFVFPRKTGKTYKLYQAVCHLVRGYDGEQQILTIMIALVSEQVRIEAIKTTITLLGRDLKLLEKVLDKRGYPIELKVVNTFGKTIRVLFRISPFCERMEHIDALFLDEYQFLKENGELSPEILGPEVGRYDFEGLLKKLYIPVLAVSSKNERIVNEYMDIDDDVRDCSVFIEDCCRDCTESYYDLDEERCEISSNNSCGL